MEVEAGMDVGTLADIDGDGPDAVQVPPTPHRGPDIEGLQVEQCLHSTGRAWQPTPVFLPGEFHGQRSLVGYSAWRCKEPGTTE